jgi:hypothetical protein
MGTCWGHWVADCVYDKEYRGKNTIEISGSS